MFELLIIAIFLWLLVKAIGLAFKLTWGVARITASILIGLALPVLIVCFVFVGGIALLASLLVVVFAALQLLGVWDKAINLAAPLMGIVLLIQSAQE